MMRSVALANQKGGVGKTTTAIHLAHGLALTGQRVALLDLDPQGNASLAVQAMVEEASQQPLGERLGGDGAAALGSLQPWGEHLWLLPSPGVSRNIDRDETLDTDRLVDLVAALAPELDWLLVDCPPRMDAWGWAGLRLCQEVLIPVQAEFFAMQGLSHMIQTLAQARQEFPGRAGLLGILVTMLDLGEPVACEVLASLRENLGADLLESRILRDAQLVEASSHGTTLFNYNLCSKGARSYGELVREVIHGRKAAR